MHRGVDLSHHQDHVDFGTLKAGGIEFVALKATEGAGYTDPTFADRWARARLVGFHRLIAYHFVRPLDDPRVQALHFARVVGALRPGEMLALDVEGADWLGRPMIKGRNAVMSLHEALKGAMGQRDGQIILYGSPGWLRGVFGEWLKDLTVMPLWAARYAPELGDVSPWKGATIWQNSERGTVKGAGAPGEIDTDVWMDEESWK